MPIEVKIRCGDCGEEHPEVWEMWPPEKKWDLAPWYLLEDEVYCPQCGKIREDKLPTLASLRGIAPKMTGDLSSEKVVRKIRDEEW